MMLDPILYTLMGFTTGTIFGGMAALSVHKARFVDEEHASMNDVTRNFWKKFTTGHEFGDLDGLPVSEHDHAFWLGYKAGHKVVAVKAGTMHFIGTTPNTSLEEQGIAVDKNISPNFGIRFGNA